MPAGGTPAPFDYGTWGTPVHHTFTLVNDGSAAALAIADGGTLSGAFSYAGGAYPGANGTCGATLAAGASCTLDVLFTPSGSGPRSGKLTLAYTNAAAAPQPPVSRDLFGTATQAALLSIFEAGGGCGEGCGAYDFGAVGLGGTAEAVFNVSNNGGGPATSLSDAGTLSLPFKLKGGAYPGTGGTCGATLASGATCTIVVVFSPTTVTSSSSQVSLDYADGAGSTRTIRRSLQGAGKP
jgi:hypothetical protein